MNRKSTMINKYSICVLALVLLVILYQLPIAVILSKPVRQLGLFAAVGCIILVIGLSNSLKMIVLAFVSILMSLCLYFTCWSIYPGNAGTGILVSKTLQYFFFWGYMFLGIIFQKASQNQKNKVIAVWFIITVITMTTTLLGEMRFPGVARLLAGIATKEQSDYYKQFNIGSYNTVYGVLMALPVWCYLFSVKKGIKKKLSFIMIIYSLVFFIITQFAFAVIGALAIMFWFIFLSKDKRVKKAIMLLIALNLVILLVIFFQNILDFFIDYTQLHDMGSFNKRLVSIKYLFLTGEQSGDILKRSEHYLTSIESFGKHPLLGGIINLKNLKLGRHSEMFDLLASLGLWGIAFLIYTLRFYFISCIVPFKRTSFFKYKMVIMITFIYLFIVNLVFNFHNVSFALFVLPVLFSVESKENKKKNIFGAEV